MAKYIHYGHKAFEKELFTSVVNTMLSTKPMGGLWGFKNRYSLWMERVV